MKRTPLQAATRNSKYFLGRVPAIVCKKMTKPFLVQAWVQCSSERGEHPNAHEELHAEQH
jgi:hypothetical protein